MPKATLTFKERALDFAMASHPKEVEEVVALMRRIAANRAGPVVVAERKKPGPVKGYRKVTQPSNVNPDPDPDPVDASTN